jgi:hypothetical protein
MKKEEEKYLRDVIDHFVEMYGFVLTPYNRAYKTWFEHKLYGEIIIDFLKKLRVPANIRLKKCPTATIDKPHRVGTIHGINIKSPIPFYSNQFKSLRFEILIDPSQYEKFEIFICVLIHELAHLVLHSTHNKYRMSEVATDLFVMSFGLYEEYDYIMRRMRKTEGYITHEQALYAYQYIQLKRKNANASAFA